LRQYTYSNSVLLDITDVGEIQPQKGRQIEYVAGVIVKVSRNGEMLTRKDVKVIGILFFKHSITYIYFLFGVDNAHSF